MLVPCTVVVPVTDKVGVELPERVTPFTVVGVIAPKVRVMAGVVVAVATLPDIPFAVTIETVVTVPVEAADSSNPVPPALTLMTFKALEPYERAAKESSWASQAWMSVPIVNPRLVRASKAKVAPVPPLETATVDPFQVPEVIVPTEVKEEAMTLLAKVVPVKVPAGATTALLDIAVTSPLPLTVS